MGVAAWLDLSCVLVVEVALEQLEPTLELQHLVVRTIIRPSLDQCHRDVRILAQPSGNYRTCRTTTNDYVVKLGRHLFPSWVHAPHEAYRWQP